MANRYRAAHYLGCASESVMAEVSRHVQINPSMLIMREDGRIYHEGAIEDAVFLHAIRDAIGNQTFKLPNNASGTFSVWSCYSASEHIDGTIGDITLGLVISGDHELYSGVTRRNKFALKPGTVYLLDNKRLHGARRASDRSDRLVFATKDLVFISMRDAFCRLGLK